MFSINHQESLGTSKDSDFNRSLYEPHTRWPVIKENFLTLPSKYDIDFERTLFEVENVIKKYNLRPFQVGSKSGRNRSRLSYQGLGLSSRPEAEDPLYDSLSLYGPNNKQLDIYKTFANYSMYKSGPERVLEILDEKNFSKLTDACTPFFKNLTYRFESPFSKFRLLQLMPGGVIPPHIDFPYYECIRVHTVLKTNPDVIWEVNGEQRKIPADGKFYWFDTGKYHAVINKGKTPRLVLSLNLLVYKNRDGSDRRGTDQSLTDLIKSGQI